MVEARYEQSPDYFKQFRKNFKFFIKSYEPDFSSFSNNLNYTSASQTSKNDHRLQSIDNGHFHVLVEVSKDIAETINMMSPKTFLVCKTFDGRNFIFENHVFVFLFTLCFHFQSLMFSQTS